MGWQHYTRTGKVACLAPRREPTCEKLSYGKCGEEISQLYMHRPRLSKNWMDHTCLCHYHAKLLHIYWHGRYGRLSFPRHHASQWTLDPKFVHGRHRNCQLFNVSCLNYVHTHIQTWYTRERFTHASNNCAQHRVATLTQPTMLILRQVGK